MFTYLLQTNALLRVSSNNLEVASFQEVQMQCKVLREIIYPSTAWKLPFDTVGLRFLNC